MRRTKRVVYIYIRQACQRFGEFRIVFGFFVVETHVFQHNDFAVFHFRYAFFRVIAHHVFGHDHFGVYQFAQAFCHRRQGEFHVKFAFRAAQMGAEDHLCAMLVQILDGRQCPHDTGFVGNFTGFLVHRDVEIHTHQYALALEILNVFNATFIHGYTLL